LIRRRLIDDTEKGKKEYDAKKRNLGKGEKDIGLGTMSRELRARRYRVTCRDGLI